MTTLLVGLIIIRVMMVILQLFVANIRNCDIFPSHKLCEEIFDKNNRSSTKNLEKKKTKYEKLLMRASASSGLFYFSLKKVKKNNVRIKNVRYPLLKLLVA